MNRILLLCFLASLPALASPRPVLDVESHGSLFNSGDGVPIVGLNFGWGIRGGLLFEAWGVFLHVEQSLWQGSEYGTGVVPGSFNAALGVEYRFANNLLRSSVAIGTAVLLFDTPIDRKGSFGAFVEVRPLGLRWRLDPRLSVGFDPLAFALVAPVLAGLPLIRVQYRTALMLELELP